MICSMIYGTKCSTLRKNTMVIVKQRAILSENCCPNSTTRLLRPVRQKTIRPICRTDHPMVETERLMMPHTSQHMIYVSTWTKEQMWPGPSMDLENAFLCRITATRPTMRIDYQLEIYTEHYSHRSHPTTHPSTGALHTPYVSLMSCWIMNFQRGSNL